MKNMEFKLGNVNFMINKILAIILKKTTTRNENTLANR